jgi:hypothetical protein
LLIDVQRGNPIGGLLYSSAFASDGSPSQIEWWTEFIGSNQFCMKICNPTGTNEAGYCQHTLDRIGLAYNCPSKYTISGGVQDGEFEVCDSDLMTVPGIYVVDGVTSSYAQPPESLGAISNIPYSPSLVASTNCVTTASAALFTQLVPASATPSASGSQATGSTTPSKSGASGSKATSAGSSPTGASSNSSSNAIQMSSVVFPLVAAIAGVAGSIAILA